MIWEPDGVTSSDYDVPLMHKLIDSLSPSGGMIVQKILSDAADKNGYRFRTIECSPKGAIAGAIVGALIGTLL